MVSGGSKQGIRCDPETHPNEWGVVYGRQTRVRLTPTLPYSRTTSTLTTGVVPESTAEGLYFHLSGSWVKETEQEDGVPPTPQTVTVPYSLPTPSTRRCNQRPRRRGFNEKFLCLQTENRLFPDSGLGPGSLTIQNLRGDSSNCELVRTFYDYRTSSYSPPQSPGSPVAGTEKNRRTGTCSLPSLRPATRGYRRRRTIKEGYRVHELEGVRYGTSSTTTVRPIVTASHTGPGTTESSTGTRQRELKKHEVKRVDMSPLVLLS